MQARASTAWTWGAGRTDAGVHAAGQVVRYVAQTDMPATDLLRALNAVTPHDVSILKIEPVVESFHPIRDAERKRYLRGQRLISFKARFVLTTPFEPVPRRQLDRFNVRTHQNEPRSGRLTCRQPLFTLGAT